MPNRVRITLDCDGPLQAHHMVQLNRLARSLKTEAVITDVKPKRAPKPKPSSAGQGSMLEGEPDE